MNDTPAPLPARRPRWPLRILRSLIFIYVGCSIVLYFLQDWMIFPGSRTQGRQEAHVHPSPGEDLMRLATARGDTVYALFGPALTPGGKPRDDAGSQPTVIFFYGNGMSMSDCRGTFDDFRRLGANVAVVEFAGYGISSGKPSEASFRATADAAYDAIAARPDVDRRQIIAAGQSIGGAVAIDMATRHPVAGVATFSAFTNLPAMARKTLPWFPTSLLIKYKFDNESKLRTLKAPTFLAHGTRDSLVPFEMNAALARAAAGRVITFIVDGADHNDLFEIGGRELLQAFGGFMGQIHGTFSTGDDRSRSR